jgi:hypothetical protein
VRDGGMIWWIDLTHGGIVTFTLSYIKKPCRYDDGVATYLSGSGLFQWNAGVTYLRDLTLYLDQRKGGGLCIGSIVFGSTIQSKLRN